MNLREALFYGEKFLEKGGIAESKTDAWLLFEYVTNINRTRFFMDSTNQMPEEEFEKYKALLEKRKMHYPLQYITHIQQFMGYEFYVDESVLVPRPETEELVNLAEDMISESFKVKSLPQNVGQKKIEQEFIKNSNSAIDYTTDEISGNINILDMCTGSGCIGISLALYSSNADVTAVDISEAALSVAKKNAESLNAKVDFIKSDLFENLSGKKFDIIVSNPPYIETGELKVLMDEVIKHEPVLALDGMEDGLYFYREIIKDSVNFLNPGGKLLFEIGYNQGRSVSDMMKQAGFLDIKVIKDLSGLDRIVCGGI